MSDLRKDPLADPNGKYTKTDQVIGSFHDYVCYVALEQQTLVQVFWYEFVNDGMTIEEQTTAYERLTKAKSITSPNLMNILSVWMTTSPPRFVVITEALTAPFISEYLKSIEIVPTLKSAIKWFKSLVLAVREIHHSPLNITHGNISTSMALIKPSTGTVKLRLPLTELSGRKIPPSSLDFDEFKSPERLRGIISQANDIWALGIVFLELLTGEPAYEEYSTPNQLIDAIYNHTPPKSLETVKFKPAHDLIEKCLQPEMFRIKIDDLVKSEIFLDEQQSVQSLPADVDFAAHTIVVHDPPNK